MLQSGDMPSGPFLPRLARWDFAAMGRRGGLTKESNRRRRRREVDPSYLARSAVTGYAQALAALLEARAAAERAWATGDPAEMRRAMGGAA